MKGISRKPDDNVMHFCFEQTVPVARERVFGFFENPKRLEILHAGFPKIRLLHLEPQVRVGGELWVEVMFAGLIPMVLGFQHTLFEPPVRFGEVATHGLFSRFVHIHEFVVCDRSTVVRDVLEICLPWHYGGEAVVRHAVAPMIRRMFNERADALRRLAGNGALEAPQMSHDQ